MPIVPLRTGELSDRQFMDLLLLAHDNMEPGTLEIAMRDQVFAFLDLLAARVVMRSGTNIAWQIQLDEGGNAQWTDLYGTKDPAVADYGYPAHVPWKHITTDWSFDRREPEMQQGRAMIFDIVESRRLAEMQKFARTIETAAWAIPTLPTSQEVWGFPTWLVKAEDATGIGFYSGRPNSSANWATVAGIAPCTSGDGTSSIAGGKDMWRNYCAPYTAVDATCLKRIRKAMKMTHFQIPALMKLSDAMVKSQLRMFTGIDTCVELECLAEQRNDNLGAQLIMYEGTVLLGRSAVAGIGQLDSDTDDPIYGINLSKFDLMALTGEYFRQGDPRKRDRQPTVATTDLDLSFQIRCRNRRLGGFVVNKV